LSLFKRPLTGEPLSLDLVNTECVVGGQRGDLLKTVDGTAAWLKEVGLTIPNAPLEDVQKSLTRARTVIRGVLNHPKSLESIHAFNSVLEKGEVLERLGTDGPEEVLDVPAQWYAAWASSRNLLHLLRSSPRRIRRCAHSDCVLYFLDSTKNGTRRWCTMRTCGNRAKAKRHYQRITRSRVPRRIPKQQSQQ
jgi:predicted RNA-binding Zn ribbon-like protein